MCCQSNILAYSAVTCSSSHTQWYKICCIHPTCLPSGEPFLFVLWKPSLEFTFPIKKWKVLGGGGDGKMGGREKDRHQCPAHSTLPATLPINVAGFPRLHMLCCFDVTKWWLHSAASFYGKNIFKRADEHDPISHFVSHYFNCIYWIYHLSWKIALVCVVSSGHYYGKQWCICWCRVCSPHFLLHFISTNFKPVLSELYH